MFSLDKIIIKYSTVRLFNSVTHYSNKSSVFIQEFKYLLQKSVMRILLSFNPGFSSPLCLLIKPILSISHLSPESAKLTKVVHNFNSVNIPRTFKLNILLNPATEPQTLNSIILQLKFRCINFL